MINTLPIRNATKSISKSSKAQSDGLAKLRALIREQTRNDWQIGDLVVQLVDKHKWLVSVIAETIGIAPDFLKKRAAVARHFPPSIRNRSLSYELHALTYKAATTTERAIKTFNPKEENYVTDFAERLKQISEGKTPNGKAIGTAREATKFLIKQERERLIEPLGDDYKTWLSSSEIVNRCHQMDAVDLVAKLKDGSISLAHLDPPYGAYRKTANCKYDLAGSSALQACDNETGEEAINTTAQVVRALPSKLKHGGIILLWQAATTCLRLPILQAVEDSGLEVFVVVTWDKQRTPLCNPNHANTIRTELLYVIARKGEAPLNRDDDLGRDNVLLFKRCENMRASIETQHCFQKPQDMMEFLVAKHTNEGELVADLFACSGSASLAAMKLKRNWVYVESNEDNFKLGSGRIFRQLDKDSLTAD